MSVIKKPDLFVIGAMKAGTTSLHAYLSSHPEIFMSTPKEPGYFVEELRWRKGEPWYMGLFEASADATVRGEASTAYTMIPKYRGVPERIVKFNPDARIIYLLRDPVDRVISQYWYAVHGYGMRRDILSAVRENANLVHFSNYIMQLRPYIDLFGLERIRVMTIERLRQAPEQEMKRLFEWLGVDASFECDVFRRKRNVTPTTIEEPRGAGRLERFRHSAVWSAISDYVPGRLRSLGRVAAVRRRQRPAQPVDKVVEYLRPMQEEQVTELEDVLGTRFDEWKTLRPGRS